jgi:hypothetical protein
MPTIARGQSSNCSNPVLDLYASISGVPTELATLEFQIFEKVTNPSGVQVFPSIPATRQSVDVDTGCPTGGRLTAGRYVATWDVLDAEPIGSHEIRWFFTTTPGGDEQTFIEAFDVIDSVAVSTTTTGYATIQDVRDAGIPASGFGALSDSQVQSLIDRASAQIDMFTGRFFSPRNMVIRIDGTGSHGLLFGDPIISISAIDYVDDEGETELTIELSDAVIYNRHISGLTNPDDRESPKLELRGSKWPAGRQNIQVTGVFGFTEYDGSPTGRTPIMIRQACVLLAIRLSASLSDSFESRNAWRLRRLKTRDQEIEWAEPGSTPRGYGYFTGDPEIDSIIATFVRPPDLGSA